MNNRASLKTPEDFNEANKYESEFCLNEYFDFPVNTPVSNRFIVLSTPRSGSTLLTSALYETGLAGAPFEYFHENVLRFSGNPERFSGGLKNYFAEIESRRTSPNGYFGMKLSFGQYENLFGKNPTTAEFGFNFLRSFKKIILIFRRDKTLQAISSLLARQNQIWSISNVDEKPDLKYKFDFDDIEAVSKLITGHLVEDNSWRRILAFLKKDYIEISYEDLSEGLERELNKTIDYLGIDYKIPDQFNAPTIKTTDIKITNELKDRYRKIIGI